MNLLFLTLIDFESIDEHNIYTDLLRKFHREGHNVYVISPVERKRKGDTKYIQSDRIHILKLKIGNIQKVNIIEKGISTITLEGIFISGIRKYFADVKFDLVLYSTPPITLQRAVRYVKKRDNAVTYLMLKDIFPQNAVDMGMLSKTGVKGILYKYFRNKEKKLYANSDYIGCMSQANVDYVLKHNSELSTERVEICPNCIEIIEKSVTAEERVKIREKYDIPLDKLVFVYGGNLGKPQGIDFLIDCLKSQENNQSVFFLIVGDGTEYHKINDYVTESKPANVKLMQRLPKEDYDMVVGACDIGMICLDHRFTIPNFPSRLLGYMQARLPVLALTDAVTDMGKVITGGNFGWWCESNSTEEVNNIIKEIENLELEILGKNAYQYLEKYYCVDGAYDVIMEHFSKEIN